jgi:hypothetical protein
MLRPDEVVLSGGDAARPDGGLVGEGMVCQIAMEVEGHAGFAQLFCGGSMVAIRKKSSCVAQCACSGALILVASMYGSK